MSKTKIQKIKMLLEDLNKEELQQIKKTIDIFLLVDKSLSRNEKITDCEFIFDIIDSQLYARFGFKTDFSVFLKRNGLQTLQKFYNDCLEFLIKYPQLNILLKDTAKKRSIFLFLVDILLYNLSIKGIVPNMSYILKAFSSIPAFLAVNFPGYDVGVLLVFFFDSKQKCTK